MKRRCLHEHYEYVGINAAEGSWRPQSLVPFLTISPGKQGGALEKGGCTMPTQESLAVPYHQQDTDYYCGAGWMKSA
jgi:hypothetical protein